MSPGFLDWLDLSTTVYVGVPFAHLQPMLTLALDASALDLGAHLDSLQTQGLWSTEDLALHFNIRGMKAVRYVCQVFLPQIQGNCLLVLTGSTSAISCLSKQGGTCLYPLC